MTVVSDTSPLNYLILIGSDELLKALFGTVAVPAAVIGELQVAHAPTEIHEWLAHKPDWIEVHQLEIPKNYLPDLGLGEREAIHLASKVGADALLMDDAKGRIAAERLNLRVFGTLGILDAAALRGFVDLPAALENSSIQTSAQSQVCWNRYSNGKAVDYFRFRLYRAAA